MIDTDGLMWALKASHEIFMTVTLERNQRKWTLLAALNNNPSIHCSVIFMWLDIKLFKWKASPALI